MDKKILKEKLLELKTLRESLQTNQATYDASLNSFQEEEKKVIVFRLSRSFKITR